MERILIMDEKNYSLDLEEIYRVAVRGIIFIDGKLLMIEDDFRWISDFDSPPSDSGDDAANILIHMPTAEYAILARKEELLSLAYLIIPFPFT